MLSDTHYRSGGYVNTARPAAFPFHAEKYEASRADHCLISLPARSERRAHLRYGAARRKPLIRRRAEFRFNSPIRARRTRGVELASHGGVVGSQSWVRLRSLRRSRRNPWSFAGYFCEQPEPLAPTPYYVTGCCCNLYISRTPTQLKISACRAAGINSSKPRATGRNAVRLPLNWLSKEATIRKDLESIQRIDPPLLTRLQQLHESIFATQTPA